MNIQEVQFILEFLMTRDQTAWHAFNSMYEVYSEVLIPNSNLLEQLIDNIGFIAPNSKYGIRAAYYMYFLILHADFNKKLQKAYLKWLNTLDTKIRGVLDIHNLEKRVHAFSANLEDLKGLSNKDNSMVIDLDFLQKQMQDIGFFNTISSSAQIPFKVGYTTTLFGNMHYNYALEYEDVELRRRLYVNKLHRTVYNELIIRLVNSDDIVIASDFIKTNGEGYNFMWEPSVLEEIGLGVDAIIMDVPNYGLTLLTGDCYIVYFFDPKTHIWGAMHIGNNGLLLDLPGKVFNILQERFKVNIADLHLWISPGIKSTGYIYDNVDKFKSSKWWQDYIYKVESVYYVKHPKSSLGKKQEDYTSYNGGKKITDFGKLSYESLVKTVQWPNMRLVKNKPLVTADMFMGFNTKEHFNSKRLSDDLNALKLENLLTTLDAKTYFKDLFPIGSKHNLEQNNFNKLNNGFRNNALINILPSSGYRLDLYGALRNRLLQAGIKYDNMHVATVDTLYSKFLFSHYGYFHANKQLNIDQRLGTNKNKEGLKDTKTNTNYTVNLTNIPEGRFAVHGELTMAIK